MNNNIVLFQQHFNRFIKSDRDISSFSPILNQQLEFAFSQGKLINEVLIINGSVNEANEFISIIALNFQKHFPDTFIFKIDIKDLIETNTLALLNQYKKYFTYCSVLAIVNAEMIENNDEAYSLMKSILNEIHESTQIIIASDQIISERFPLYKELNDKAIIAEIKKHTEPIEAQKSVFSNFAKFISDIKEEAGVNEQLDEVEIRDKYIEKLYVWEMKNFNVNRLKKIINNRDINKIKDEFDSFTSKVRKLMELHKDYGVLNTQHFNQDAKEIEELLFDPDSCDIIEKKINELKDKINYFRFFRRRIKLEMYYSNFIPDSTNRSAYDKITQIISKENTDLLITITGSAGSGKSHLLNAILNEMVDDKVIILDKENVNDAVNDHYIQKHLLEMEMLLIDDFDDVFNACSDRKFLKQLVMNSVPKVITMHRKYSIEDKELLEYLNQYPTLNIQPSSLFIEKSIIKQFLNKFNIPIDEIMLNTSISCRESHKGIGRAHKRTNPGYQSDTSNIPEERKAEKENKKPI